MNTFKLNLLDDNEFFLEIFKRKLLTHAGFLEITGDLKIDLKAYSSYIDFFDGLHEQPDLVFLDFNLGSGYNAFGVIDEIRKGKCDPSIVIVTEQQRNAVNFGNYLKQIDGIIRKDVYLIPKACVYLEEIIRSWRVNPANA